MTEAELLFTAAATLSKQVLNIYRVRINAVP